MKLNDMSNIFRIIFIISFIFNCSNSDKPSSYEEDIAAINKFLASSGEAVKTGNVEAEVNRFTENGIYMWPNGPTIIGHDSLYSWFQRRFKKVTVNIENITEELEVCNDWAFERGKYIARIRPKNGGKVEIVHGKYLNIFKKQSDGTWRISHRIRNRNNKVSQP
jgi:ketosteroid isomerase-like protein